MRSFGDDHLAVFFERSLLVAEIDSEDLNVLWGFGRARPLVEELTLQLLELGGIYD